MRSHLLKPIIALIVTFSITNLKAQISLSQGQNNCENDDRYQVLNFWVGEWDVFDAEGMSIGENTIKRISEGCAITEDWVDSSGNRGYSLFYFNTNSAQWKQVWVTENAANSTGGQKEKTLISSASDSVIFQGWYFSSKRKRIDDRTILKKINANEVNQIIQLSIDGGQTWFTSFDAKYRRR